MIREGGATTVYRFLRNAARSTTATTHTHSPPADMRPQTANDTATNMCVNAYSNIDSGAMLRNEALRLQPEHGARETSFFE